MKRKALLQNCEYIAGLLAAIAFVWTGCDGSKPAADSTAADIRGEPINAPLKSAARPPAATPTPSTASTLDRGAEPLPDAQSLTAGTAAPLSTPRGRTNSGSSALVASLATPGVAAVATPDSTTAAAVSGAPGGRQVVNFDRLASFNFIVPEETVTTNGIVTAAEKADAQIPETIKALDQTSTSVKGFMLPLKVEAGLVTELLLMRDQSMCCYGKVPRMNEWVSVKMKDKGVKAVMDQPVTIHGKLFVGEQRENGYLVGIYRMEGDGMSAPE